ncbi:MAG: hypothetical protein RRY07_07750, partial [Bacteroidaceae bacterium]
MGYAKWEKFQNVIDKAKVACENAGEQIAYHFHHVGKMVGIGSGSERRLKLEEKKRSKKQKREGTHH